MKLYYSPGACSLSPHIALLEAGLPYDLVKVDLQAKKLENGDDYLKINPEGPGAGAGLDNGELVTEGPVIVQMIADKAAGQEPGARPRQRRALQAAGVAELHHHANCTRISARCSARCSPTTSRPSSRTASMGKFKYVDSQLAGQRLPDGQAVHRRRRLSVHDAGLGRPDEVRPVRPAEPDGLQGPRRARGRRCRKR